MGSKKRGQMRIPASARLQRRLWGALLAACVVVFFIIAVILLSVDFGVVPPLTAGDEGLLGIAELCAIAVFAIELCTSYARTPDKKKFLMQNWLAMLAILPLGVFIRSFRAAEGIGLLRPLQGTFRIAEADFLVPALAVSSRPLLAAQQWLAHFQVFRDFFALAREWKSRIFR
ncbi:MAG: hypothetical protein NTX79_07240 [Candidatus Micrarchaeota archaeon]|nr:hypothetical protein [Candidatus Micrarchaeota archaeon]